MGLDLSGNGSSEPMYDKGDGNLAVGIIGSVTIVWLTTEADDQSSLHCITVSTEVMSYCNCYYYTGKHSTHSQQQHQYFTKSAKQITPNRKL